MHFRRNQFLGHHLDLLDMKQGLSFQDVANIPFSLFQFVFLHIIDRIDDGFDFQPAFLPFEKLERDES